jgi:ABC-type polysaccharide/polyol phosphate export permease
MLVCDHDETDLGEEVLTSLDEFNIVFYDGDDCEGHMIQAVKDREYLFGIIIDKGFTAKLEDLQPATIKVYYDNSEPSIASLATWKIDTALEPMKVQLVMELGRELKTKGTAAKEKVDAAKDIMIDGNLYNIKTLQGMIRGVESDIERVANLDPAFMATPIIVDEQGVHADYSLVDVGIAPLFVILSLFVILMLCSTGVIYDRKIMLIERIRASNSSMASYMIAKLGFFFAIVLVQFVAILLIFLLFGASYEISFGMLAKALLFLTIVNTLLGMIIGMVSDSEGIAVLISLMITLPLLFLSGMFYPLDLMPHIVQWLAKLLPLHTEVMMMKEAMLFGGDISGWYILVPLGLSLLVYTMLKRR